MARTRLPGSTSTMAVARGVRGTGLFPGVTDEVDLAQRVNDLLREGEPVGVLERIYGQARLKVLRALPGLPAAVQELVRAGRLKAGTAVQMARDIGDPVRLTELLQRADLRVHELCTSGRRRNRRITLRMVLGRQTLPKVVKELAAQLKSEPLPGCELLVDALHGLLLGWDAESIVAELKKGEHVPPPIVRKRGRKRKAADPS